ncbi:MAG TPA: carbamoyltransferase HypF [Caldilineae bacterium]|nr:carbamoyltransferase HypF [Caldilineae bacterium]
MEQTQAVVRRRVHVRGVVQGVGFRPFIYNLARRYELYGWVCNTSSGVDIEVEGPPPALDKFLRALTDEAPPLARIDAVESQDLPPNGYRSFEIRHSQAQSGKFQPISPDVATCDACLAEVMDPADRRYRYPFTNCTHCGPRFTIIRDIPYDRPKTTMAAFAMCPECQAEYDDPADRRFHAQPNACPTCGPRLSLVPSPGGDLPPDLPDDPIEATRALLARGWIVAIKGLGGFHLACDARDEATVQRLRARKGRVGKPFALMVRDLEVARALCYVNDDEARLLTGRERPIVLLRARPGNGIAPSVAPRQRNLGIMLPYTPLHHLLLLPGPGIPDALVMTSGNLSEEPIAYENDDALRRLAGLADAFLLHNRDIYMRCDDSVVRVFQGAELPIRRSRGYAPYPVHLGDDAIPLLACGAELKNTFCITRGPYAFLSQHIGDMENLETLEAYRLAVAHFERLFRVRPQALAYDLHPDYLATRYALERAAREGIPAIGVQHHHAHIAACLAEHQRRGPVIGVAFDGTGYGEDGAIWGGEFLIADLRGYQRVAHLAYVPLPGGDAAVRRTYRMAWSHLHHAFGGSWPEVPTLGGLDPTERRVVRRQIERGLNAPPTSSMGRLFDAVSALCGICQMATYEGQAAIELEMLANLEEEEAYDWSLPDGAEAMPWIIDPAPVIRAVVSDIIAGVDPSIIAARFHNAVARMIVGVCRRLREATGIEEVALSGGVWQNALLLERTLAHLKSAGFTVHTHRLVPPNDGGLSLGQAAVANARMEEDE